MHISARIEYALRALCTLAARSGEPLTAEELADAKAFPFGSCAPFSTI